ncbi:hypothetical protein I317_07199 [Kwoniella heveanensis CBS 569]|nr:hypothetical protein I317_07199 [Kwoniella heveanensis CBS 569]
MAVIKSVNSNSRSKSSRAGLTFPVARLQRYMRQGRYAKTIATSAAVFMAASLEYLIAEVMEMGGNAAKDNKSKTIKPRHLKLAISNDDKFNRLIGKATIAQGGVRPHIAPSLLPRNSKANNKKKDSQTTASTSTATLRGSSPKKKSVSNRPLAQDEGDSEQVTLAADEDQQEESAAF